jgi:hypothetical protein
MKNTDRDNHRAIYRALLREERIVRTVGWLVCVALAAAVTAAGWVLWQ